jgi:TetR/AcrR family transcriptional regulator
MQTALANKIQTERADATRARILEAAINEFSENGLAGARTEQIAEAAGVNKALLYYYFQGKEALYAAALELVAERAVASNLAVLDSKRSAGERMVHFALNHFDRIYSHRSFHSLLQQELMRLQRGEENALTPLVERVFRPMMSRIQELLAEGMRTGELIQVDEWQIFYASLGANVFYFLSGPVIGILRETDVYTRKALVARRKAAVEFLGQAIFCDRKHGARVAARVLAATPMPEGRNFKRADFRHLEVKGK